MIHAWTQCLTKTDPKEPDPTKRDTYAPGGAKCYVNPDWVVYFYEVHSNVQELSLAGPNHSLEVAFFFGTPAGLVEQLQNWKKLGGLRT